METAQRHAGDARLLCHNYRASPEQGHKITFDLFAEWLKQRSEEIEVFTKLDLIK